MRGEETFADANRWVELSRKYGVRLPLWRMPCTTGGMRRFLKKINVPVDKYLSDNADRRLDLFIKRNPDWPLRAWAGIQLENLDWEKEQEVA